MAILNQIPTKTIPLSKAKYTRLDRYQVGSPVQLVGYFLYKETDTNNVITVKRMSFGFKNESEKNIIAIRGSFTQKDAFGDALGELKYSLVEMDNYQPGAIQGEHLFMDINLGTIDIEFSIEQVVFADGSKWMAETVEFIRFDIQTKLIEEVHFNAMKYAWFLESKGFPIKNHYVENNHFYQCPCGNINGIEKEVCSLCHTPKSIAKPFADVSIASVAIEQSVNKIMDDFNQLFPDAVVKDSSDRYRFNENAILFDSTPLKKLREFATQWKGVNPIVKEEIKKTTDFVTFIETLKNKLLKEENDKKQKALAEQKAKTKKQRMKILSITLGTLLGLALIGFGAYYAIFGKLAFETRNTYEAFVTLRRVNATTTSVEVRIDDIDFTGSNFEFYGIVFDDWCTVQYCYDEVILNPDEWVLNITDSQFTATAMVNLSINGMQSTIKYLEFNSRLFNKNIYVPNENVVRYY